MEELLRQILSLATFDHPGVIVALLSLVVLFLYWCGTRGFADLKKLNVSGPKPLPFLGNMLEVKNYGALHLIHLDYFKKYGKVFAICLGGRPTLVVGDPELLKQIMVKDFSSFHNRFQFQRPLNETFARNVTNARDETWKRIRNTLTPTFSAGKMKLMAPLIENSCDTLVEKLEKISHTPSLT